MYVPNIVKLRAFRAQIGPAERRERELVPDNERVGKVRLEEAHQVLGLDPRAEIPRRHLVVRCRERPEHRYLRIESVESGHHREGFFPGRPAAVQKEPYPVAADRPAAALVPVGEQRGAHPGALPDHDILGEHGKNVPAIQGRVDLGLNPRLLGFFSEHDPLSRKIAQRQKTEYEYEGERLDKYVSILFPEQSRSFFQKLIKDGNVSVNDKVQKANYRLKTEDLVTVEIPDAVETQILPEDIPLDILYEDDDLLVVNKPKGMVVHPSAGHYSGTLVNVIMYHCKDSLSGINGEIRPGIVHRIDMDTTGSLIVCKNDESHIFIAEQIKEHSVNRRYRGIVYGVVSDDEGTIHAPIGRHPVDRKKMAINEKNGKDAITHYKVLERFDKYTYMEFKLETGRTHQIRVHMASIGHPLLGDTLYSNGKSPYKLQGQTLHAMTIGFIHPRTREYMEISAPLPEYFEKILRDLR